MRILIAGASTRGEMMAALLAERGHELVIIDRSRPRIDELADTLDCGYLHGDATRPDLLREADPAGSDILFCLTDHDQANILAALVGRSLGVPRVVVSIQDPDYEELCRELGLEETVVPDRTISRYLADLVEGVETLELQSTVKGEARFFTCVAADGDAGRVGDLDLPEQSAVVCRYRGDEFELVRAETTVEPGDELVILTHSRNLPVLRARWEPETAEPESAD